MDVQIIFAAVFPLLMFVGGIAAWRMTKRQVEEADKPAWRDDSLDDWRKERDAEAEAARATRPADTAETVTGSEEQRETTTKHQRIGG